MLTAERLREVLHYDPETGIFTWRVSRRSAQRRAGEVAGYRDTDHGYWRIYFDRGLYYGHRLAWLYMTGSWPVSRLDHVNLDPADNRFANLREATHAENMRNRRAQRNNTSGFKGVRKKDGRWEARIMKSGHYATLGRFDTPEEAHAAYCAAAAEHHGEFARVN